MIRTYKCSGCGSGLIYQAGTDNLLCPKCGSKKTVSQMEAEVAAGNTNGTVGIEEQDAAGNAVREFKCPSCGAVLVTNDYTAATSCAYCQCPTLIESRTEGAFTPKKMIPFKFDKKQAQANFKEWAGKGLLTPPSFKSQAVMDKVTGVYVPYWLYTYQCEAALKADAEKVTVTKSGDTETVTTEHYTVEKTGSAVYEQVPMDASSKMDDSHMEVLEPFDYNGLVDFALPYLAGFMAEKYEYNAKDLEDKVKAALKPDMVDALRDTIEGYTNVSVTESSVDFKETAADYAMLPVWTLNFKYGGQTYPLYMNGQTGKIDGTLPVSKQRVAIVGVVAFIIVFLIAFLLGGVL